MHPHGTRFRFSLLQRKVARQKGLEPLAYCLEGSCSIQLSYWRIDQTMERVTGIEPASPAWKAGALAIVLHPHAPSVEIVSLVIIAYEHGICQEENRFLKKVFIYLTGKSRVCHAPRSLAENFGNQENEQCKNDSSHGKQNDCRKLSAALFLHLMIRLPYRLIHPSGCRFMLSFCPIIKRNRVVLIHYARIEIFDPRLVFSCTHIQFCTTFFMCDSISNPAVMLEFPQILIPPPNIVFAARCFDHLINIRCDFSAIIHNITAQLFKSFIRIHETHQNTSPFCFIISQNTHHSIAEHMPYSALSQESFFLFFVARHKKVWYDRQAYRYMQRYRSGHNGADSKSVWSNPRGFESHPLRQKKKDAFWASFFFIGEIRSLYRLEILSAVSLHPALLSVIIASVYCKGERLYERDTHCHPRPHQCRQWLFV